MTSFDKKEFSFSTIENFDDHIDTSIPGYSHMNDIIINSSKYFIEENTKVIDIGCSTGKLIKEIENQNKTFKDVQYIGIEKEKNFTKDFRDTDNINLLDIDIIDYDNFESISFITSIFTLQFISIKERENILKKIYNGLNKGGAFIMSEKIYSDYPKFQDMFTFMYYDYKQKTYTPDDILSKERDLRKIMKPLTYNENISMLKDIGFTKVEVIWKNLNFISFICIK